LRRTILACVTILAVLAAVLAGNTLRQGSRQAKVPAAAATSVDAAAVARRLSAAVQLRTISWDEGADADRLEASRGELRKLHTLLEQSFPRLHAVLRREQVGELSLLYTWPGTDPSARPILLLAHQDVVPISPGTESLWHAAPFSGEIRDGFVWGRGAWDDKGSLMAILEAVESLVAAGFEPRRTIYLAFGHDEETDGTGARAIARLLAQRGVRCEFALDEGLVITQGVLPGLRLPAALVGIAEKGSLTLRVGSLATAGHTAWPPSRTAIGALAGALTRIEAAPMPAAVGGVAAAMLAAIAPEMGGLQRVALSNLWLFGPLVRTGLEHAPSTNALVRTTTAITVIRGGNKENVLPAEAEAWINFRLLPGDRAAAVVDHVRKAVADPAIRLDVTAATEASPVSSIRSASYRLIEQTIRGLFPGVIVAPGLVIAATDSRQMAAVADDTYRFMPVRVGSGDLARFHGIDERISIANYVEVIQFYELLIRATTNL
jgi:carboxypeptidase PM20D1